MGLDDDYERQAKRRGYVMVALAGFFLLGQCVGAVLNLWGWPSDWF